MHSTSPRVILLLLLATASCRAEHHHHMGNIGMLTSFQNSLAAVNGFNAAMELNRQNPLEENRRDQLQSSLNQVADNIQKFYQDFDKGMMDQGNVSQGQASLSKAVNPDSSIDDNLDLLKKAMQNDAALSDSADTGDSTSSGVSDPGNFRSQGSSGSGQVVNLKDGSPWDRSSTESLPVVSNQKASTDSLKSDGTTSTSPSSVFSVMLGRDSTSTTTLPAQAAATPKEAATQKGVAPSGEAAHAVGEGADAGAAEGRGPITTRDLSSTNPPNDLEIAVADGEAAMPEGVEGEPDRIASQVSEGRLGGIHRFQHLRRTAKKWTNSSAQIDRAMGVVLGLMIMVPACALFYAWGTRRKMEKKVRLS
jgi:hypothetical protein